MAAEEFTTNESLVHACHGCKDQKPWDKRYFKLRSGKPGHICKECVNKKQNERRSKNRSKHRQYSRNNYAKHREKETLRHKTQYDANPGLHRERVRKSYYKYHEKYKEKYRLKARAVPKEIQRERAKAQRIKFGEKMRAHSREYYKKNKEAFALKDKRRRARSHGLPADFTQVSAGFALSYWGFSCAICGRENGLWWVITFDHWIPLCDTGQENPGTVPQNMLPICHAKKGSPPETPCCNNSKAGSKPDVWVIKALGIRAGKKKLKEIRTFFLAAMAHHTVAKKDKK